MVVRVLSAFVVGSVVAAAALSSAQAADRRFCEDYARAAVNQYRGAVNNPRCIARIQDTARWSPDFRHHFDWCLDASRRDAITERDARKLTLDQCVGR